MSALARSASWRLERALLAAERRLPRTLGVNKTGRGAGTVTSSPAGIACGADCAQPYPFGQAVILTAVASSGSVFEGFSGCDSTPTATSCRVTMTANRSIDAVFNPPGGVTVERTGGGVGSVVSDDGLIACGAGSRQCSERYATGTRVRLTASAAAGSFFDAWGGACAGVLGASCEVVATGGFLSVTATFGQAASLTISFPGAGTGFVDSTGSLPGTDPQCVSGAPCTLFFRPGTSVSLTATATTGLFTEWGGDCAGAPRTGGCQIAMFGNRSVTATFLADPVVANVLGDQNIAIAANGASCDQPCDRFFERGTVVTFVAQPRPGRIFTGWGGDCASFGDGSCVLEMTGNRTVSTTVLVESYVLTVFFGDMPGEVVLTGSSASASCTENCTTFFTPGDTVTVEAFDGWFFFFGFGATAATREIRAW